MSRQNKVNPGLYTQRGRLTQDDAARELRKQSAAGSRPTWQPVNTKTRQRLAPAGDAAREAAPANANAKAAKTTTARTRSSERTTGNTKTGKARTTAKKQTTKPTRHAVLARNAGGRRAVPPRTSKRGKR